MILQNKTHLINLIRKSIFLLICILGILISEIQAQSKTAFEKRKEELTLQYLKKLGVSQAQINRGKQMGEIEALFTLGGIMEKLNTMEGLVATEQFSKALKNAEKLKTEIDFKRDRERKVEQEKKKQIEIAKQDEKRKQQELLEEERERKEILEEQERERVKTLENERLQKIVKYNNSDFVKLKTIIKEKFENWLQKNEFEKTEDYQNRVKSLSQEKFEKINIESIKSSLQRFKYNRNEILCNLGKYNADAEYFPVLLKFKKFEWYDSLKIPLSDAVSFKNNFSDYEVALNEEDWCLVENYWHPKKVNLKNTKTQKQIEFLIPVKEQFNLNFTAPELGFNQPDLKEVNFNLTEFKSNQEKLLIEKREKDAIAEKEKKEREDLALQERQKENQFSQLRQEHNRIENQGKINLAANDLSRLKSTIKNNQFIYEKYKILTLYYDNTILSATIEQKIITASKQKQLDKVVFDLYSLNDTKNIKQIANNLKDIKEPTEIENILLQQ